MKKMKRRCSFERTFRLALLLALTALSLWCLQAGAEESGATSPSKANAPDTPIALVNGTTLYERDLQGMVQAFWMASGRVGTPPEGDLDLRKKAFAQLVEYELLYQDGLTLGPQETEKVEKEAEDTVARAAKQMGGEENLREQLAKEGLTLDQARKNLRRNFLVQADVELKVVSKVQVAQEELLASYQSQTDRYRHEDLIGARHILVSVPQAASDEQKKEALARISALRKEWVEGKDFAELATTHSDCPSRQRGGDLGYFPRGTMVPEFEGVAFSLKEGEVSEPVQTQYGYHLILVYGKKPAGIWPFEEVQDQIERELRNGKTQAAFLSHLDGLRQGAKIEILDRSLEEK
ncbi:MAG: peptidylprolyl isomerase [candidate division NC10 bacterium]|nr:peptidylprolyl isomerase [candidate division NC10 bacterium]